MPPFLVAVSSAGRGARHGCDGAMWMGAQRRGDQSRVGVGCSATTLDKAAVAGEGERWASSVVDALAAVACVRQQRKEISLSFKKP
jgi:hypothetical protein